MIEETTTNTTDEAADLPLIRIGDHVVDRDRDDSPTALVVGRPGLEAEEYDTGRGTVAELNPGYPDSDGVVEVVFIDRTAGGIPDGHRYAYPRERLKRVASLHADDTEAVA